MELGQLQGKVILVHRMARPLTLKAILRYNSLELSRYKCTQNHGTPVSSCIAAAKSIIPWTLNSAIGSLHSRQKYSLYLLMDSVMPSLARSYRSSWLHLLLETSCPPHTRREPQVRHCHRPETVIGQNGFNDGSRCLVDIYETRICKLSASSFWKASGSRAATSLPPIETMSPKQLQAQKA